LVHKAEHVGDITKRNLLIKRIFVRDIIFGLWPMPGELLGRAIVVEMPQLSQTQLAVKRQPLLVQFGCQLVEMCVDRLTQRGNVHLTEHVSLFLKGDELIGEAAVL
jgi:hypothetical protein